MKSKVFLVASALLFCLQAVWAQSPPNVVFILVDDYGWRDSGVYGSSFYETPNIDRLAKRGARFTRAYTASPVCSPTRASILTGRYPSKTYHTDWFGAPQPTNYQNHWTKNKPLIPAPYEPNLELEEITWPELMQAKGYSTFFAGKWHLGETEKYWPENQGFHINKGGHDRGGPYKGYFSPYNNPRLSDGPEGEYLPMRLASETVQFIEQNKNKPFLAYLSFYSVHTPLQTTEALELKYLRKRVKMNWVDAFAPEHANQNRTTQAHAIYGGMVEAMDQAVGQVLTSLEKNGLLENTIVVFFSDNGGLSTAEGSPTSNLPLRAGKGWLYEGGIRVPLIISWPNHIPSNQVINSPVMSIDLFATLMDLTKTPVPSKAPIDGVSLAPLLQAQTTQVNRETLFWHYPHYGNQGGSPSSAIQKGDWKLLYFYETEQVELYNVQEDIGEQNNLASVETQRASQMKRELMQWLQDTQARFPTRK